MREDPPEQFSKILVTTELENLKFHVETEGDSEPSVCNEEDPLYRRVYLKDGTQYDVLVMPSERNFHGVLITKMAKIGEINLDLKSILNTFGKLTLLAQVVESLLNCEINSKEDELRPPIPESMQNLDRNKHVRFIVREGLRSDKGYPCSEPFFNRESGRWYIKLSTNRECPYTTYLVGSSNTFMEV